MNARWMTSILVALGLTLGMALAQDEQPGEGVSVQPAVATWQSALPLESIFAQLLEELGYEVEDAQSVSNPIFYQSVTQGDVDYWPNGWFPIHNAQLPDGFEENAERVGTIVEAGAVQGYLVDADSAEEYDITSLEDFKRDEVKEAFDRNGDGLADLVACPPGWGCEQVISHHMDAYELHDHVNPITAAYSASFADALAAYNNDEPILFYTWTPNFTVVELVPGEDVVWINVPETIPSEAQQGLEDAMTASGIEGAVTDPLDFGFVANDIVSVANSGFLEQNPAARALFEQVEIPLIEISDMTRQIGESDGSDEAIAEIAGTWIENNRDMVDGWLEEARSAAN